MVREPADSADYRQARHRSPMNVQASPLPGTNDGVAKGEKGAPVTFTLTKTP